MPLGSGGEGRSDAGRHLVPPPRGGSDTRDGRGRRGRLRRTWRGTRVTPGAGTNAGAVTGELSTRPLVCRGVARRGACDVTHWDSRDCRRCDGRSDVDRCSPTTYGHGLFYGIKGDAMA